MFKIVNCDLVIWTQPSCPLCLWKCLISPSSDHCRAVKDTCVLFDNWSEGWGDITWPARIQRQRQRRACIQFLYYKHKTNRNFVTISKIVGKKLLSTILMTLSWNTIVVTVFAQCLHNVNTIFTPFWQNPHLLFEHLVGNKTLRVSLPFLFCL